MALIGRRPNAGQEIRVADIERGNFEATGGLPPSIFAENIKEGCNGFYGQAGLDFVRKLSADLGTNHDAILAEIRGIVDLFLNSNLPRNATGQLRRVAQRFGLVAAAGELATRYGITGWKRGAAIVAAETCFSAFRDGFGDAPVEEKLFGE